ncbi:hypothetical protein HJC23_006135 [Cyclotella cryptica]|uniref:F-box domain-containing protein n=1 Tax=Cyclotella cryptica TaxID=29204 RepID=A0ABD3QJP7_9STRA
MVFNINPRTMSATNNINIDSVSLFDDDDSLNKICFDFDDPKGKSWCTSSDNSSCCSLCRLPNDVDEDARDFEHGDDDADSLSDLEALETLNDLVSFSTSAAAPRQAAPLSMAQANPNNNTFAASMMSTSDQVSLPLKRQACYCSSSSAMMMPSLFNTCAECQSTSPTLPNRSTYFTQFASKNSSFLTRHHHSCTQLSPAFPPSSVPAPPDFLTAGFLPEDPVYSILTFLDVRSLTTLRLVNTKLRSMASDNNAGWKHHCAALWSRKVRVCDDARRLFDQANAAEDDAAGRRASNGWRSSAMEAYKTSILEAESVNEITEDDLCFDLATDRSGVKWSFRFKESAGLDWTSWDPWWKNGPARKLVFLRDGSILQAHPPGRSTIVTTHNGTPLYDVFSERLVQRNGVDIIPPRIEMRWRFVESSMDLPSRPDGAYVRITVGGRDVPTYVVRRSPNGNWGFIMESCWGLYASFELASREDATSSLGVGRRALRRTRNGSRWVNVDDENNVEDTEEDNIGRRNVRRRVNLFVEESAMTVTGVSQWREALLYNIGAVTLPEGNHASSQFDAAWQNALLLR